MNTIKKLPKNLINKIAAGEVVERPASVVKELVENSIDAGATRISVSVKSGGFKEITVEDNGIGIPKSEIELAFARHATSKISSMEDLNRILSFGFRGEALSSISAISDVELHTFREGDDPVLVEINDSLIGKTETKPRQNGTTISIIDLFRYVPARKKFLSSENTEFKHIQTMFNTLAISAPEINFELKKDGKVVSMLKSGSLLERIEAIYKGISDKLLPINYDSSVIKATGFIGHPSLSDISSPKQFMFINKRAIQEKSIISAIKEGYATSISRDKKPSFFIFFEIDPEKVDVNVHPRKMEAKIDKAYNFYPLVKHMVEKTIQNEMQKAFVNKVRSIEPNVKPMFSEQRTSVSLPGTSSTNSKNSFSVNKKSLIQQSLSFTENILSETEDSNHSKYVGQVFNTYLIFESEDKLIYIDQHAADERVKFEILENQLKNSRVISSPLLAPLLFDLQHENDETIDNIIAELEPMGIEISKIGKNSFQLTSIPEFMNQRNTQRLIDAIINDIDTLGNKTQTEQVQNKLISTIACHSSIRAGDKIESNQAYKLIEDLFKTKLPYSCPHGRPIMWEVKKYEISKNFERNK